MLNYIILYYIILYNIILYYIILYYIISYHMILLLYYKYLFIYLFIYLFAASHHNIMQVLHGCRVRRTELPAEASIGKDQWGKWRTTALNEYPPALCMGLASALRWSVLL